MNYLYYKETHMNETIKTLVSRRSCRKFIPGKMPSESDLNEILKAGIYAPSGMGRQPVKIIVITNKELRDKISCENGKIMGLKEGVDPFYGAPVIMAVIADKSSSTYVYDGSLVIGNLLNAAESLGLGSIWIHRAKEEFEGDIGKNILKDLGIEGSWEGIGHVALGYADEGGTGSPAERKDNIHWIK